MVYTHKICVPNASVELCNDTEYEVFLVAKCNEMSWVVSLIDILDDSCHDHKRLM